MEENGRRKRKKREGAAGLGEGKEGGGEGVGGVIFYLKKWDPHPQKL